MQAGERGRRRLDSGLPAYAGWTPPLKRGVGGFPPYAAAAGQRLWIPAYAGITISDADGFCLDSGFLRVLPEGRRLFGVA